jgi:hypothetical protein
MCFNPARRLVATRSPHDVLGLVFTVGAQVFSETLRVETCESAPEMASQRVFAWLNLSPADNADVHFHLAFHGGFSMAKALFIARTERSPCSQSA